MASGGERFIRGQAVATGAIMQIQTGQLKPRSVVVVNRTHPGRLEWNDQMDPDSGLKVVTAGTNSFITSNGITQLTYGFQLGADAAINQSGDILYWTVEG